MAKIASSASFKNFRFRVTEDEENGGKKIYIIESTKEDEIYTNFQEILDMFGNCDGLTMTIKYEKGLNE